MEWKNIEVYGVGSIEKCVGEFNIAETLKTPYGKFKVKVYERQNGGYIGYTNLQLKDEDGCGFPGVGHGETIEEALKDTIEYFLNMINENCDVNEENFECSDPFDF
ncbi:TPA: hypothetical protein LA742_003251 [Clostridium botulinum]|uniref:hypothetical protein n=1 Tax=Clostridium TaxID=1485 RepID=UPI00083C3CE0|nr:MULTISPECIES: hypothetical protein [Clostridium]AVQ47674.1 hypothetical protein C7M60_18765 [Clostridium botulinum]AVQ51221.1 hypothetical protein C7M58_18735 [Clostridium botulinum]EJO5348974.1 hypothetical protein [Clostridium botulinum]MCW6111105.1 hypothetical protein [Clostridium sporogenes]HBJ2614751.1 hypothetical protein [Clostridium botulinum]